MLRQVQRSEARSIIRSVSGQQRITRGIAAEDNSRWHGLRRQEFLALLGIGASRGRGAGAAFLYGHFAGDVVWASLSLAAVIGARTIGTLFFDLLGIVCGLYLTWLGLGAGRTGR